MREYHGTIVVVVVVVVVKKKICALVCWVWALVISSHIIYVWTRI
jgi:hypothetical protein